jgi:zinc transporter ZupT
MLLLSGIFLLAAIGFAAMLVVFVLKHEGSFFDALEDSVIALVLLLMTGSFVSLAIIAFFLHFIGPIGTAIGFFVLMALVLYLIGRFSD